MSEWKVDIGVVVTAETPEQAAAICAALLSFGAEFMPLKPAFVGVHGDQAQAPQAPMVNGTTDGETDAAAVFSRIMAAPDA